MNTTMKYGTTNVGSTQHGTGQVGTHRAKWSFPNARSRAGCALAACVIASTAVTASGAIVVYTDRAAWQSAAGATTTIGVPDVPSGVLNTHYTSLGVNNCSLLSMPLPDEFADSWGVPLGTNVFVGGGGPMGRFSSGRLSPRSP